MMWRAATVCLALLAKSSSLIAADSRLAVPPAASQSIEETIPAATLREMDRRELGDHYRDPDAEKWLQAHSLIEDYFSASAVRGRREIVKKIEALELPVGDVGRIARICMHWPSLAGGGVYYVNEPHGPFQVRYFVGVPKNYDRARPWPLVVMLPTASAFVTEPPPDADGVVKIYTAWIEEELARHPDAAVLMPLLNLDELYGPSAAGMHTVIQPMVHAAGRVNIDPRRVYLVGHGMSAHAVWNLPLHFPTYFAAISPFGGAASGDWQRLRLLNLRNVLPVVWHDAMDDVVKVGFARSLVKSLREAHIDVIYDETNGLGHTPSPEVIDRNYRQMRQRVRELYPPQVWLQSNRLETPFNRNDWVQVYQPTQAGKEHRLLLRRGSGIIKTYQRPWRVQASVISPNHIDATTDNVATLRFYLNDEQFDLSKPITIVVNGKGRLEKIVPPNLEEMLKDQLVLGRGWRSFAAVVDVEAEPLATTQPTTGPTTRKGKITVGPSPE